MSDWTFGLRIDLHWGFNLRHYFLDCLVYKCRLLLFLVPAGDRFGRDFSLVLDPWNIYLDSTFLYRVSMFLHVILDNLFVSVKPMVVFSEDSVSSVFKWNRLDLYFGVRDRRTIVSFFVNVKHWEVGRSYRDLSNTLARYFFFRF